MRAQLIFSLTLAPLITSSPAISSPAPLCLSQPHSFAQAPVCPDHASNGLRLRLAANSVDPCDAYNKGADNAWAVYLKCVIPTGIVAYNVAVACLAVPPAELGAIGAGCTAAVACYNTYNTTMAALDNQYGIDCPEEE